MGFAVNMRALPVRAAVFAWLLAACSTQYADPVRAGAGAGAGGGSGADACAQWSSETECARDTANDCSVQPNEVGCHLDDATCTSWTCASGDPFVRRSGSELFLQDQPFRFVGANAWGVAGRDGNCQYSGFSSHQEALSRVFGDLADMRVQVLRAWAFQSFCGASGTDYSALDQVVRSARSAGVRLIFVLENMWEDCSKGKRDDSWFRSGYREPYGGYALSFPDYASGLVAHFRDEPTLLAWEIMHEAGGGESAPMLDFATQMTTLVRNIDRNHLIVLGSDNGDSPATQNDGAPSPYTVLQALDTIDMVDSHDFFSEDAVLTDREQASCAVARSLHKACFIGASAVSLGGTSAQAFSVRASQVSSKAQAALDADFAGYLVYAFTPGWQDAGFDFDARPIEPLAGRNGTLARFADQLRAR
jgi:mannan endo-1,4-beta-mannosidase